MKHRHAYLLTGVLVLTILVIVAVVKLSRLRNAEAGEYSGTQSCRPCHEKFYRLWDGSHHGLAMRPVDSSFVRSAGLAGSAPVKVGGSYFMPVACSDSLIILEYKDGDDTIIHKAVHVMGGKYVFYFLTLLEKGRLQVLPLAYDVRKKEWYDNPGSGVRHFESGNDSALDWQSYMFTFNTSCYGCHVSQLTTNFNLSDMSYNTVWREPGINCETCHGPAGEHIKTFSGADSSEAVADQKIISVKSFSPYQHNSSCGSCHAKMIPVVASFVPGTGFYDAFDLVTLENHDFYPDGRDLGENYTYTSWEMNRCKESSSLNCITCHTSSGRNKFRNEINGSCMPCHSDKVGNPSPHTRHDPSGKGSLCVSCHMPVTEFARMERSDHSFRPPSPAATIEFGSPNACNICHSDKSPRWADEIVTKQRGNYQDEMIRTARLLREARNNNWKNVSLIEEGIKNRTFDHVFTASFIRLAESYQAACMHDAIVSATAHPSPLVRAASAHALTYPADDNTVEKLLQLAADSVRLVRLYAGHSLALMPRELLMRHDTAVIAGTIREYAGSLLTRKDQWGSWYNLGNFYAGSGDAGNALSAYNMAVVMNPDATVAMVNAGFIHAQLGAPQKAEDCFLQAIRSDSTLEAANLNLALLYGEMNRIDDAERYFNRTLRINPQNAVAAYNLAVIWSDINPVKALEYSAVCVKYGRGEEKYLRLHEMLKEKTGKKKR